MKTNQKQFRRSGFFHVLGVIFFLLILFAMLGAFIEAGKKGGPTAGGAYGTPIGTEVKNPPVSFHK